jgi:pyruvate dehydrogenase E2 component (dihydrolipoamide acetyltransferase)
MTLDFRLPDLGEGITEADVVRVLVQSGDAVVIDQAVVTIETEKATIDVPSGVAGTVTAVHVAAGQTVKPGAVLLTLDESGARPTSAAPTPSATPAQVTAPTPPAPAVATAPAPPPAPAPIPAPLAGAVEAPAAAAPTPPLAPTPAPTPTATGAFAAPSVRLFAREIGVDIASVRGSGAGGRIDVEDVKLAARERGSAAAATPAIEVPALPDFSRFGPVEREPLSRFRRTVARNMATTWSQVPMVTLFHTADLGAFEGLRRGYRDAAAKAGGTVTNTVLLLKLVGTALQQFPQFNSTLDIETQELILKRYIHIGLAVETERGLAVSVVQDVDKKDVVQLSVDLKGLAERAKENALTIEEMRGASFTISSLEALGVGHFTPLVNWPEVAILGIGRDTDLPAYEREELHSRRRVALSLSFDHRVVDGADGARFLRWLVNAIHQPTMLEPGTHA